MKELAAIPHWLGIAVVAVLLNGFPSTSLAHEKGLSFRVGSFYSTSDSGMDVTNPDSGDKYTLDFESDLQLVEKEWLPYIALEYWFNDRHGVYVDYRRLHRNANDKVVTVPYEYEDVDTGQIYQIKAGADITTTFNVDIARLGYAYDFYSSNDWELTVTLGLHVMWMELSFSGEVGACIDDNCEVVELDPNNVAATDVTAPLPDIGILASYKLSDNWRLSALAQYFYVKIEDTQGELVDLSAGVGYKFNDHFYADLMYKYYKIDVQVDGTASDLDLYYGFQGPQLAITYRF